MLDDTLRHRSEPNFSGEFWECEHGETVAQCGVEGLEFAIALAEMPSASSACDFEVVSSVIVEIL